jgi:hypothetical protein
MRVLDTENERREREERGRGAERGRESEGENNRYGSCDQSACAGEREV